MVHTGPGLVAGLRRLEHYHLFHHGVADLGRGRLRRAHHVDHQGEGELMGGDLVADAHVAQHRGVTAASLMG